MFGNLFTKKKGTRVRMAPSPTGNFHIGTARTSLFNFLFARHTGGTFILRVEDTDTERSKPEFEANILDGLRWMGISWDEFYRQSERTDVYRAKLKTLIDSGRAYVSKEPAKNDPSRTVEVVRLRNPGASIAFQDTLRGTITTDTKELGDFVIARSIDDPLYHLAVVIDDCETGITNVLRGEDHISNTARQILIMEALEYARPVYTHLPLILAPDRSKLSKRAGATAVDQYRDMGVLPEAFVNFLALLGWNPGTEQEIFSLEELAAAFSLEKLQKSGAIFNMDRLMWFNREHLKRLPPEDFAKRLEAFAGTAPDVRLMSLLQDRASTLKEAVDLSHGGEYAFLKPTATPAADMLIPRTKEGSVTAAETKGRLQHIHELLHTLEWSQFSAERVKEIVWPYAEEEGRGNVLWPMRVALTSAEKSPDPFIVSALLGKEESLRRLEKAIDTL
jgi:glutamyl-tRNA synthetase